jgi:DNA-binding protein YbaB
MRTLKGKEIMMDDTTPDPPAAGTISPELLAQFGESDFEPVSVTIADLVTVRMDARYQVVEVTLHRSGDGGGGGAERDSQLETALREAFNEALRQVMGRNAARLSALMAQGSSEKPPASAP